MALALRTNRWLCAVAALGMAVALCALLSTLMLGIPPVAFEPRGVRVLPSHGQSSNDLPVSLEQLASEVVGGDHVGYWLKPVAGGFEGVNAAQRLKLRSEHSGIELTNETGRRVGLTLARATVGGSQFDLSHVVAHLDGNRLVYDTGQVQQAFVNGPLGVEQRFLIRRAPVAGSGRLELLVGVSGARAAVSLDGRSALLTAGNGPALKYAGLQAHDSRGWPLPAYMRVAQRQLALEVLTRGARFPITVDPLLSPYAILTGPTEQTSRFGSTVAVSSDGNTAAIGGESDDGGIGAVWVFTRSGKSWTQQGPKLTPEGSGTRFPLAAVKNFGSKVAISADGNRILVGDSGGLLAAWFFVRTAGTWRQQGQPLTPRTPRFEVASSEGVALSGNGRTAVISGRVASNPLTWVYVWSRGRWRQRGHPLQVSESQLELSTNGSTLLVGESSFVRSHSRWRAAGSISAGRGAEGFSRVALSGDGSTAMISSYRGGYALVYRRSRRRWTRVARLTSPHPEAATSFAEGVVLSADGGTALIAASPRSESAASKPVAYVFTRTSTDPWTASGALTMSRPWRVALSGDGTTVVEPTPLREVGETITESGGPVHILARAGSGWQEQAAVTPSDATGVDSERFGGHVALSADGATALVSEGEGTAWVFARSGESWSRQARLHVEGTTGEGSLLALSSDGNTAVLAGPSAPGPVAAWVFTRSGATWSGHGTPLIASGSGPRPPGSRVEQESFASSVAVSSNGSVILVGADWDSGRVGAVWTFTRSGGGWVQQGAKLTPSSPSSEERFGHSLSLSANGEVALIGAVGNMQRPPNGSGPEGAAYVFARSGATWAQTAKLIDGEREPGLGLGSTVALSADASTALLGANEHAIVFTKGSTGWQQHRPSLTASPTEHNARYGSKNPFGARVVLSADGTRAVFGGGGDSMSCGKYMYESCTSTATVWAFSRAGEAWVRQPLPLVRPLPFGSSGVAIAGNGETVLIQGRTPGPEPGGAAYVSQLTPPPQSGFVIEATNMEYEGAFDLDIWTPASTAFRATARVLSPAAGLSPRCNPSRHRRKQRCSQGLAVYGTRAARGVENLALSIAPRAAMRKYLARHGRVRLAITISARPSPPALPSTQTIPLTVTYTKSPSPEF